MAYESEVILQNETTKINVGDVRSSNTLRQDTQVRWSSKATSQLQPLSTVSSQPLKERLHKVGRAIVLEKAELKGSTTSRKKKTA